MCFWNWVFVYDILGPFYYFGEFPAHVLRRRLTICTHWWAGYSDSCIQERVKYSLSAWHLMKGQGTSCQKTERVTRPFTWVPCRPMSYSMGANSKVLNLQMGAISKLPWPSVRNSNLSWSSVKIGLIHLKQNYIPETHANSKYIFFVILLFCIIIFYITFHSLYYFFF